MLDAVDGWIKAYIFILILSEQLVYRVKFAGVKKDIDYDELEGAFGEFGHVGQLYMDINPVLDAWSGTGYVDFLSEDAARDAASAQFITIRDSKIRLRDYVVHNFGWFVI